MSGLHDAAQAGAGHLLSFTGTDSIPSILYLRQYYTPPKDYFIAGSIPATEHSVMCMGEEQGEIATFRRLITELYPTASFPSSRIPGITGRCLRNTAAS